MHIFIFKKRDVPGCMILNQQKLVSKHSGTTVLPS